MTRAKSAIRFLLVTASALFPSYFTNGAAWSDEPDANRNAIEKLRLAIDQNYSYRDLREIDWNKRIDSFESKLLDSKDAGAFVDTMAELLSAARDVHVWLKVGERTVGTFQRKAQVNFNPRVLPKLIPQLKQHGKTVLTGKFADDVRYVAIGTWENREPQSLAAAIDAIARAAEDKAPLIIDVRPNSGGDERLAREIAALFVTEPKVYGKHVFRRNGEDGALQERVLEADRQGRHHTGPCLVLMGPANMSSCESFLLMMRAAGCRLVGERSYGSSGNPQPHDLGNGVTVFLPSWRNLTADGATLEGVGVAPDVVVEAKPDEFMTGDPVLVRARELINPPSE